MSNPTSNFGWVMPTNTDLVTDLPADFAVFGQGVDTTMADLKGGTTGQILSKATNTDMDFTWITNDVGDITAVNVTSPITGGGSSGAVTVGIQSATTSQSGAVQLSDSTSTTSSVLAATPTAVKSAYDLATTANTAAGTAQTTANTANSTANAAIPKSTVTAKGSIVAATASSTPANLAVGNNGETLVADSSTSTGLRYQAPIQQNPVINSAMQVWQRGTSFAVSGSAAYTADRWQAISAAYTAGLTVSRQATSDTTNLPFIQYCARVQRDSGNTSTAARNLQQNFESVNSIPFAGKTVTLSFYARAGANYSAASSGLGVQWVWGTGTDQNNYLTGLTGSTNVSATTSVTLTTTWQRFSITGTVGSTATQIAINYNFNGVGTAGTNDYFEVTGVQMEVGSVATPFHTYAATLQGELAACQRYYQIVHSFTGNASLITQIHAPLNFVMPMRTSPSVAGSAALYVSDGTNDFQQSSTNVAFVNGNRVTSQNCQLVMTNFTGMTQWRSYMQVSTAGGDIQLSAEL